MAILSAKYLYAMLLSLSITVFSFMIGGKPKEVSSFKETMDLLTAQSHVSLQLAKMRVDTVVARTIREHSK